MRVELVIALALTFIAGYVAGSLTTIEEGTIMHRIRQFMFSSRKRKIMSTAAILALTAGVAAAAWLISGSGDGSGRVGTLQPVLFSAGPVAGAPVYPGSTGDASIHVTNPNGALVLTGLVPSAPPVAPGCPGSYLHGRQVSGLSIPIPAGASDIIVPDAVRADSDTPQSCSGSSFTAPFDGSLTTP